MVSANLFHCRKNSWPPEEYLSKTALHSVLSPSFFLVSFRSLLVEFGRAWLPRKYEKCENNKLWLKKNKNQSRGELCLIRINGENLNSNWKGIFCLVCFQGSQD